MKRYTIRENYECRMKNCQMENYLRNFYIDTDIIDFCDECPFINAINRLADLEDEKEVLSFDPRFDHG